MADYARINGVFKRDLRLASTNKPVRSISRLCGCEQSLQFMKGLAVRLNFGFNLACRNPLCEVLRAVQSNASPWIKCLAMDKNAALHRSRIFRHDQIGQ